MKHKIETLYLQYFNEFLTVSGFASYHHMSEERAQRIINIGRRINHKRNSLLDQSIRALETDKNNKINRFLSWLK